MNIDDLFENSDRDTEVTARTRRILDKLRIAQPQAKNDLEALTYSFLSAQNQDREDISRLDQENDSLEKELDQDIELDQKQERDIEELKRKIRRVSENKGRSRASKPELWRQALKRAREKFNGNNSASSAWAAKWYKAHGGAWEKDLQENAEELNIGDDVIITGNVQYKGKTGVIKDFGRDKRFVIVDLYNHGPHSFNSSDVSYNEYADSEQEEADWQERELGEDDLDEGWKQNLAALGTAAALGAGGMAAFGGNAGAAPSHSGPELANPQQIVQMIKAGKIASSDDLVATLSKAKNKNQVWSVLQNAAGMQGSSDADAVIQRIAGGQAVREDDKETTDVYRRVFKKNGKPVGEVGIDLDAAPGNGDWYVKHYASGTDYSGYDTRQDAIDELKYMVKMTPGMNEQGVAEGEVVPFPKKEKPKAKPVHCPKCGSEMQGGKIDGERVKVCVPCLTYIKDKSVDEGVGKGIAKLAGITAVTGAAALGGQYLDDREPKVEFGNKQITLVTNPGWGTIPDQTITVTANDGKQYKVWKSHRKGGGGHWFATPAEQVKEGLKDPKDNPCWKGYHPVGTKKKGGRTVPNCVPGRADEAVEDDGKEAYLVTYYSPQKDRNVTTTMRAKNEQAVWNHCAMQGRDVVSIKKKDKQLDELSFMGSPCTVDCSGHRAGYEWGKRKGQQANSWSTSFNNGARIAVTGK